MLFSIVAKKVNRGLAVSVLDLSGSPLVRD